MKPTAADLVTLIELSAAPYRWMPCTYYDLDGHRLPAWYGKLRIRRYFDADLGWGWAVYASPLAEQPMIFCRLWEVMREVKPGRKMP